MVWSESEFEESMPNTLTYSDEHALGVDIVRILPDIHVAELASWGVSPDESIC